MRTLNHFVLVCFLPAVVGLSCAGLTPQQKATDLAAAGEYMQCLAGIGAAAGIEAIPDGSGGVRISGQDIGWNSLKRLIPCLLQLAVVSIETATQPPASYFGSNESMPREDRVILHLTPRPGVRPRRKSPAKKTTGKPRVRVRKKAQKAPPAAVAQAPVNPCRFCNRTPSSCARIPATCPRARIS